MTDEISMWRTAAYGFARARDEAWATLATVREYLETSDDTGIRTREHLLGLLDQEGVPSTVGAELTRQQVDTLATDLRAGRVKRRKARIIDAGSHPAKPGRATMAADRCPQCGGDNTEAWAMCGNCETTGEPL